MIKIRRIILKYLLKLFSAEKRALYIKRRNILHNVGDGCKFTTTDFGNEPYLISIHNNVEIASNVRFITHDNSCFLISKLSNKEERFDKVGSIEIFDNVFVGANAIIMPNVKIGPNAIIAAGSVVTKDVEEGTIVGGNPAKVITDINTYTKKMQELNDRYTWNVSKESRETIVKKRIEYFWSKDRNESI